MVKYTAPDRAETQKRFSAKSYNIANILFWVGIVLIAAVLIWTGVATFIGGEAEEIYDSIGIWALIVSAVIFALGLVFRSAIKKNIANAQNTPYVSEYVFEEYYMTVTDTRLGEKISESKIYYRDLAKIKEEKDYIALYPNSVTAHVIFKDGISAEDLAEIKSYLKNK
ncbi:MAG: YcxB family protein [Clostridia bacterium]|nr:YcxB family protein [Clostridia bacterium]